LVWSNVKWREHNTWEMRGNHREAWTILHLPAISNHARATAAHDNGAGINPLQISRDLIKRSGVSGGRENYHKVRLYVRSQLAVYLFLTLSDGLQQRRLL
jgi:hypothetical protein